MFDEFAPFSLFSFLTGTLIYAFREFYVILLNASKLEDGRTGYMNYGFWNEGPSTTNPHANLVKAVLEQLDVQVLNMHAKNGQVNLLEIGCGLGQSAIDAVHSLGTSSSRICLRSLLTEHLPGSNVSITGVSISKGHVATANKLAASAGLSSKITHHLLNATKIDSLPNAPFSGAYSCEVISEIPDDGLRACFAALHDILPPGAEFSYADIVRTEATLTSRASSSGVSNKSRGLSERILRLVTPKLITMLWGDDWRPMSRFNSLLSQAGFEILSTESIGDRVFIPTWDYARERMQKRPDMGLDLPYKSWLARFLTRTAMGGLAMLWEGGQVDYVLVKARRV
jgi:cyclopropane fatty-acyl-phospholipid synthase-like methyltransferase